MIRWIQAYEKGERERLDRLPFIALTGTPFQMTVWKATIEIPPGGTMTYGELARSVEDNLWHDGRRVRGTPRRVGTALSKNPVLLLIPCYRIVGVEQRLTGYSCGIERKAQLLAHEQKNYDKKYRFDSEFVRNMEHPFSFSFSYRKRMKTDRLARKKAKYIGL